MLISLSNLRSFCVVSLIVAVSTLNFTSQSNIIIGGLVMALCLLHINNISYYFGYKLLVLTAVLCAVITGIALDHNPEFTRLVTLMLVILAFPYHVTLSRMHYIVLFVTVSYLVVIQVGYGYFDMFEPFLDSFYPVTERFGGDNHGDWFKKEERELQDARYAGVFYNPNLMGQCMLFLYACYLPCIRKLTLPAKIAIYMIFFTSALLTGSRTATIIMLILGVFSLKPKESQHTFFLLLILIPTLILWLFVAGDSISNFRGLDIASFFAQQDVSGNAKWLLLKNLWYGMVAPDSSTLKFLFGIGVKRNYYDAELAYMLDIFGVWGITTFIVLFMAIYRDTRQDYRYVFFLFLISIGATVIINFRFSILIFIVLSLYNSRNKQWLKSKVTNGNSVNDKSLA